MFFLSFIVFAPSVLGNAEIRRHTGAGCTAPTAFCLSATQGNCCKAPSSGMFPTRANGVGIFPDQDTLQSVSIPYTRGNGVYCGNPVSSQATYGYIGCYQSTLLGSGLYIKCTPPPAKFPRPQNATEVFEKRDTLCPNQKRAELSSSSSDNVASEFTDEHGNPTDAQGYVSAIQRMEDGIAKYGETRYYLHKQTGIAPEDMVFNKTGSVSDRAASIVDAYAGIHHCSGESLASVTTLNTCYTAGEAASFLLHESVPGNCVLNTWANTPDCSGDSQTVAVEGSQPGCFSGMDFDSLRLDCVLTE